VKQSQNELRVLVVATAQLKAEFQRQLAGLNATLIFVRHASDLSHLLLNQELFHVVLLPPVLPEADWRGLWNEICLLNPRPALLVYAHSANFHLWSAVLESGGYDVLVEPFTDEELQGAVLRAARSLEDGAQNESRDLLDDSSN
jgi:DNA-binding NtrC family response regulator